MCIYPVGKNEEFHKAMKKSIVNKQTSLSADDSLPTNESNVVQQIKEFNAAISSSSRQKTYIYCLTGNLTRLKHGKKGKKFIEFVHRYLPAKHYSRSQIYLLMSLHKLALKYNKLVYVSISNDTLKSKFRIVKQLLAENEEFWRHV